MESLILIQKSQFCIKYCINKSLKTLKKNQVVLKTNVGKSNAPEESNETD